MAQYYQFSLFTLAGTAEDMSGGLMHPYSRTATPWTTHIARLPYRDRFGVVRGEFYAYKRRTALVDEYMSQVRSSILFRRGWILQEWLLSKRLLWYTPAGLFYECQEELPRAYDQAQIVYSRASEDLRAHLQLKASFHHSNEDILGFWYHALEVYSGQHLTKPEMDRILAVAGLAKELEPILSMRKRVIRGRVEEEEEVYAAGLWLRDIHHGLLWEQEHTRPLCTDKVDRVPSWSWASLMTPVRWPGKVSGTKPGFTTTGICFAQKKQHQVPDYTVYNGHHLRPSNRDIPAPQFDPTNMSACLHLRGKLHVVHIRGYLETEDNLKRAALSTTYAPVPKTSNWRAVCSAFRPEIIAGWASMEQMAAQHPGVCDDYGIAVYALIVSTRWLRHGLWLKTSEPVQDVLYVEEVADSQGVFKRLGVGRIGDRALIAEFEDAEERDIQLV
ncbi:hypothetical protein FB567DRAFT_525966 [Paraphoma chrysanthemicola]|uniref:Heterokaryon incompatibility domain-containing protein n=1 Tax=Paraphoma chrysanthemicola TaxID=798071 RepID=A0A8K0R6C7_9PLEO|nr:hypothetical protein FB567DRAFT_525966 [Paraphoma chrysanthemicola]